MLNEELMSRVIEKIERYANGREVVFWGKHEEMRDFLGGGVGIDIQKVFTRNAKILREDETTYFHLENLNGKSEEYYVVISVMMPDNGKWQRELLRSYGYTEELDYIFYSLDEEAVNGNKITGKCTSIRWGGKNNIIEIEDGVEIRGTLKIVCLGDNCRLKIGRGTVFGKDNFIKLWGDRAEILIGEKCKFTAVDLRAFSDSQLHIGNKSTFLDGFYANARQHAICKIGEDCMFSLDIVLLSGDGHSIFDINTKKNFNSNMSEKEKYLTGIIIGDHVWVGRRAMVLGSKKITQICKGSVVGAQSTVKGTFPNNVALGGNPAKILRKDVAWSRKYMAEDIDSCYPYVDKTEEVDYEK